MSIAVESRTHIYAAWEQGSGLCVAVSRGLPKSGRSLGAELQWRCPGPCPLVSPESTGAWQTSSRSTLLPSWGCHCPPHHSHLPWPFPLAFFPCAHQQRFWPSLPYQSSSLVCKCPETPSEPQQAHHRAQGHLQSVSQMIWTFSLVHNPLSVPLSQ